MPIKHSEIMSSAAERIQRTEAYAEKVRKMFAETVNDILALNKSLPKLDEGTMYSFDNESMKKQKEVERLLRRLHSAVVMAVKQGITLEWEQANQECDKLVSSAFGKEVLSSTIFKAWTLHNTSAMQQFINRSEKGLDLSDRVWKPVRQLRDEMEVAITIGIGEGESAASMSRKVRQYLNDPDLMFRRFRYKNKKGEWKLKWKKRIKDTETGKYKWIDYDKKSYQDEWTGKGYYKSSAQNAMRVTRTETNIAYRRADHERWSQMDFVLGQRVQLSHNHPKKDICDKLQGDYPKEFIFDGWHPQCFCYVTPILVDESEMKKSADAFLKGEKYTPQGKQITEYPEAFKDWVKEHAEDIKNAREVGKEPYFIKNNAKVIDNILNPKKQLTTLEKAKIRHEARTAEQRQNIIDRWEARKKSPMRIAANRHAARTPEQIKAIKEQWAARQKKHEFIKKTANNVLNTASNYGEVDFSKLQQYISENNLTAMQAETKIVAQSISAMKKQEAALSALIPDVHNWHKQFTLSELQTVYDAVENKLKQWASLSLEQQAKKLNFEAIDFLGGNMNNVQSKYKTWKVSQAAYMKKLTSVNEEIVIQNIKNELSNVAVWSKAHTKSKKVANLLSNAEAAIANGEDITAIKQKAGLAIAEYQKRLAEQARRDAKKLGISNKEITALLDDFNVNTIDDMDKLLRDVTEKVWATLSDEERLILTKYTQTYAYLNEPLRGITYFGGRAGSEYKHDLPILTQVISKFKAPKNMVVRRGTNDYNIPSLGYNLSQVKVGDTFVDGGFLSTAAHRTKGFFSTNLEMVIIVPKGAQGVFAEPFSHYTDYQKFDYASNDLWNGASKEVLGTEFEWIGQRGSQFKVIKKQGNRIYLQLIGQLK